MAYDAPLESYRGEVLPEWVDPNGHFNVAYYMRAFDLASDAVQDLMGIGWSYLAREGHSIFMLEAHVCYLEELSAGDPLRIATRLLDYDAKRFHLFHEMFHGDKGYKAATSEWLGIHVDMASRRSVPFPETVRERLAVLRSAHERLPWPEEAGRTVGIRRKIA